MAERSADKYRLLFDSSNDVLVQLDLAGTVIDANRQLEAVSGYKPAEVLGQKISALAGKFTDASMALIAANFAKRKLGINVPAYEVESLSRDGRRLFFEVSTVPLKDDAGKQTGELVILHDITERKRAADELKQKMAEVEELNKFMIGREERVIELKQEVNGLLKQLGQPAKYRDI
ncbi:MAG: PAS domain S-box protein [Candidatus Saganbacteria bacterium]|nr:PAS domain S-box protein [Candidatus Saganbacteria bacterium]